MLDIERFSCICTIIISLQLVLAGCHSSHPAEQGSWTDLFIGGYLDIHSYDGSKPYGGCGKLNKHSIYLKEAMRYAIVRINNDVSILRGISLYARIYDSCGNKKNLRMRMAMLSHIHVMGILGPMQSDLAIFAVSKMAIFNQLMISHAANSMELNDRERYGTFFRTTPSEEDEISAIVDILRYFNWSYISVVNSYGYNGQQSAELLISKLRGICVATHIALPKIPETLDYKTTIERLLANTKASVVVLLVKDVETKLLLHAAEANAQARLRFTWISGTKFMAYKGFVAGIERAARGALVLSYSNMTIQDFDLHVNKQTGNYLHYDWLQELMPRLLNCTISYHEAKSGRKKFCSGKEELEQSLSHRMRHVPVKAVISAVETIACGVLKFMEKHCFPKNLTTAQCKQRLLEWYNPKDSRIDIIGFFQNHNSHCHELPYSVNFDKHGSVSRNFDVLNFDGKKFQAVGVWKRLPAQDRGLIRLNASSIQWSSTNTTPTSQCSFPCKHHEKKIADLLYPQCCFSCKPCSQDSILVNNTCIKCPFHQWPDNKKQHCYDIPTLGIDCSQVLPAIVLVSLVTGLSCVTFISMVYMAYFNSPIIKASSRESSIVILLSLYALFGASILFIVRPGIAICALRRIFVGMSLTSCYGALMLKTNRIFRIFKAAGSVTTPVLVSTKSQITICLAFLSLQIMLCITWLLADPPSVILTFTLDKEHIVHTCKSNEYNFLLNLLPCSLFMLQCTFYAYKMRRFPENFNEAYSIVCTMYANCFVWAVFIPLKLWLKTEETKRLQSELINGIFGNVIGLVSAIGLFGPKMHRLFFRKQNTETMRFFLSGNTVSSRETIM